MKEKLEEDIRHIRDIMDRSTRFRSLAGLSGVAAGIVALAGAALAWRTVFRGRDILGYLPVELDESLRFRLPVIALGTFTSAAVAAVFFSTRKSGGRTVWNSQAKRFVINFGIPLLLGGLACLSLFARGFVGILPALSLLFYGLALLNAGRDTFPEIKILGLLQAALGLVALQFTDQSLWFWAFGFGVLHIVSGMWVKRKYGS